MMRKYRLQLLVLAVILAIVATGIGLGVRDVILVQVSPQLISRYVTEVPKVDPLSPLWDKVPAMEIPLAAQQTVPPPFLTKATVSSVSVRSVNDGQWVSFLVEWNDVTKDTRAGKPDEFRDAAAIQFPVDPKEPGVCMGFTGFPVNLWHWKADWQTDIDKGFQDVVDAYPNFWKDYYPFVVGKPPFRIPADFDSDAARAYLTGWAAGNPLSDPLRLTPIETLVAQKYGTAEHHPAQAVVGRGVWTDGKWRVVFSRPMVLNDSGTVQFQPGGRSYIAFAVWNGSNQEVGARKQVSADTAVTLESAPAGR